MALTGHALAGISEGAKKAGCDAFVTKPCLPEDLVKEIRKVLDAAVVVHRQEDPQERQICENHRLAPAGRRRVRCRPALPAQKRQPAPKKASGAIAPVSRRAANGAAGRRDGRPRARRRQGGRTLERRSVPGGPTPPASRAAASRGKYVYCIIEATDPLRFGPIGIGADPSDVYTVHYKNLAAVVSDAPLEVLDSTRENVLAHERVNETVMREHTVIPMSFGTIFKTREDIVELLRSAAEAFGDVLNKMQNKLEFGLKVLWDRDQAIREVEADDEDISRLKKEISGQKGPTYFARMQYGRLVDAALQTRSERYVARHPRPAPRRVGRLAHQQADRRQDDHERRVPDLPRPGDRVRREGQVDRQPVRQADVQVHRALAAVQLREHPAEAGESLSW